MGRGRPKEIIQEEQPTKFKREYQDPDGTKHIWSYDLQKFENGPISVDIIYPKSVSLLTKEQELSKQQKNIPLTKRTWINPTNGKEVGYARAKTLNLIK